MWQTNLLQRKCNVTSCFVNIFFLSFNLCLFCSRPTEREETEKHIRTKLKELMMSVDLDDVTSKYVSLILILKLCKIFICFCNGNF